MAGIQANARRAQLQQMMARVPEELRGAIAKEALESQKSVLAFPYYSTVRLDGVRSGGGPFTYTVAGGPRKAFNYKIGDAPGVQSGFPLAFQATMAETNLLKASETRDNADVLIWGLAIENCSTNNSDFAREAWRHCYVQLSLSGTDQHLLGPLTFFPSAGGLYGSKSSSIEQPPLDSVKAPPDGHLNNGNPTAGNYFRLPHPVRWEANGSGKKDTSLIITVSNDLAIAFSGVTARAPMLACPCEGEDPPAPPVVVAGYDPPADGDVFVDLRIRLISVSISERSTNT